MIQNPEAIVILGGLISALIGYLYGELTYRIDKKYQKKKDQESYQGRIDHSLKSLKNATGEIDNVITEIGKISKEKHETIEKLEHELQNLSSREIKLKDKIETMEKVPLEVLKHFEEILNKGQKRGAKRDYILFIAGVITTTLIAILINYLF